MLFSTTGMMAVFVKSWRGGCVGNLIITIGTIIIMLNKFHSQMHISKQKSSV